MRASRTSVSCYHNTYGRVAPLLVGDLDGCSAARPRRSGRRRGRPTGRRPRRAARREGCDLGPPTSAPARPLHDLVRLGRAARARIRPKGVLSAEVRSRGGQAVCRAQFGRETSRRAARPAPREVLAPPPPAAAPRTRARHAPRPPSAPPAGGAGRPCRPLGLQIVARTQAHAAATIDRRARAIGARRPADASDAHPTRTRSPARPPTPRARRPRVLVARAARATCATADRPVRATRRSTPRRLGSSRRARPPRASTPRTLGSAPPHAAASRPPAAPTARRAPRLPRVRVARGLAPARRFGRAPASARRVRAART